MANGVGTDLSAPLSRMWRDVYQKAAGVAEARTRELLKYHVYVYPHGAGGGGGGGGGGVYCLASDSGEVVVELPSGTAVTIPFDRDDDDPFGYHDPTTYPKRFTVPAGLAGWHRFSAFLDTGQSSPDSPPKEYDLWLSLTPADPLELPPYAIFPRSGVLGTAYALQLIYAWTPYYYLKDGDYVELVYTHNNTFDGSLSTSRGLLARFALERLGPPPASTEEIGNATMATQTTAPTGASDSLWFNPSETA